MEKCIHEPVCKHRGSDQTAGCSAIDLCKYYAKELVRETSQHAKVVAVKYGRGRRKGKLNLDPSNDKDIQRARSEYRILCKAGKINDNQRAAWKAHEGKHAKKLAEIERRQIIAIINDARG